MPSNADLARLFTELAAGLELTGANPFRVRAHEKVARILEDLPGDAAAMSAEELQGIDGIGEGSAKKIREFVETGRVAEHDELWSTIPRGLLEVMNVPGLGPKTIKLLWEHGGVIDLATLRAKLADGSLAGLPRMGGKTLANIQDALAFMEKSGGRIRLGEAMPIAESIVATLRAVKGIEHVEFAGSLRRGKETIGDIDILACGTNGSAIAKAFVSMPGVEKILVDGETKCSVRLSRGVQADLRIVDSSCFGAALLYFTGSKEHNVRLRELAIAKGWRLNEYGLFKASAEDDKAPPQERGAKPIAARTEAQIYAKLGRPWIPPEQREDRGELARGADDFAALVAIDDIRSELHAHTIASDGGLTIDQLAGEAKRRGFHTIAVTDHSKSSVQANGLSPERLLKHIAEIRAAEKRIGGIHILAGSEVDILADGTLDYDDELLRKLDVVVASPHASLRQEPEKATARLLKAVRHPLVNILGHPTGRLINDREGLSPDIAAIAKEAAKHGTALEINSNDWRLDLRDTHVRVAIEHGAFIAIDCDVHAASNFDMLRYGIMTARRGGCPKDACVNTWDAQRLRRWLARR
ncbi:MAG: DNA polymerase/3'-5' exonuclease PolX [Phycisphaerales bacterium]